MVRDCVTDTESQVADDISVYSVQSIKSSTNSETSRVESVHGKEEFLGVNEESVFLLIDARPEEEYAKFKIQESISFPAGNLKKDKTISSLYRMKN